MRNEAIEAGKATGMEKLAAIMAGCRRGQARLPLVDETSACGGLIGRCGGRRGG